MEEMDKGLNEFTRPEVQMVFCWWKSFLAQMYLIEGVRGTRQTLDSFVYRMIPKKHHSCFGRAAAQCRCLSGLFHIT